MRKYIVALSLLFAASGACKDPTHTPLPPQIEGTVHLEGDSVTWNTYWETGVSMAWASSSFFTPGQAIDKTPWKPDDIALDRVPRLVSEGKVDKLVWALGLNEIGLEGWSVRYQLLWTDMLQNKVPSASCIVLVKPWVLPIDYPNRPLEDMNAIRLWIDQFAVTHPNVVLVDWKPIFEANPQYTKDGVHLEPGSGAAEARDAMYREGLSRCAP